MQKLTVDNPFALIGTWAGFEFNDPAIQQLGVNEIVAIVRDQNPGYDQTPVISRQRHLCRELLLKHTLLGIGQIGELIHFTGTAKAFVPLLQQALTDLRLIGSIDARPKIRAKLEAELEALRGARIARLWEMAKAGALGTAATQAWEQHNSILDAYTTTLSKIMRGTGGVNDTLEVQSCVVGAGYALPTTSDTALGHQLSTAKAPDDSSYTGYQTTFLTPFKIAENNGAETTASAVASALSLTLTSATGFATGDRVIVTGTGLSADGEKRTITLSGSVVTFDTALSATPLVGAVVRQIWGETGLRINGDSVLGTHSRISDGGYDKGNGGTVPKAIYVESAITLRIVGL